MSGAGVKIGDYVLKDYAEPFVIAEAGSNHNQSYDTALKLIDAAAEAGADAVKFQLFAAEKMYPAGTEMYEIFKSIELDRDWIGKLSDYAQQCGVMFLASAFDEESVDVLDEAGVKAHKMASSEVVKLGLLRHTAAKQKPIILSTGQCDLGDVFEAVEVIQRQGNDQLVLLQCTSQYPTLMEDVNLRVMDTLRGAFRLPVGFSDHTMSTVIAAAAVARGACVIEKHFTLSRDQEGPDHPFALEPDELKEMVDGIRAAHQALGSPVRKMHPAVAPYARRGSLHASRDIMAGEILEMDMIVCQRPADGVLPRFQGAVLGQKVVRGIEKGGAIRWEDIGVPGDG